MRSSIETMNKALSGSGIYDVQKKNISAELATYKMVLDELNLKIETLIQECFIDSAKTYGIENRELVIGAVRDDLTLEERRQMLQKRELINASCFTLEKIKEALYSFGLSFEIYEYPQLYEIILIATKSYESEQVAWIRSQIKKIMPAHLYVNAIFTGLTWSQIDDKDNSFSYMDSCDMTWDKIDDLE